VTDRQTDGQIDRILLAIPRLHYMQRGKNQLLRFDKIIVTKGWHVFWDRV